MHQRGIISTVLILILSHTIWAQQANTVVTGVIIDTHGASLPGISVLLDGTTTGDATDKDGTFSIPVGHPGKHKIISVKKPGDVCESHGYLITPRMGA